VQRTVGNVSTNILGVFCSVETADSIRFVGQTATLSFYARKGANYSQTSSTLLASLTQGTGTNQNIVVGFTGQTDIASATPTLTTTWQRFSVTGTVATTTTQIGVQLYYTPAGTAGADDYFEVTGVQVELGSVPTTFKRSNGSGGTIQGELAACQRYFFQSEATSQYFWSGQTNNTSNYYASFKLPTTMRVAPTVTLTSQDFTAFPTTAGSAIRITTNTFVEARTANATANGGYFGSSVIASAEL
jgi:hypothetical protein